MDVSGLILSILIFAPGVVLLTACVFVGGIIALEKTGLLGYSKENLEED
tara:strand:- start:355 stop:501 length:147 start_codon:yes stop_codon:yes gene_type:complete